MAAMKLLTAKVLDGRLDIPAGCLREGDVVTLLVPEPGLGFELTPEEKEFLLASIAQADRGEVVDGWELLEEIED